MNFKDNPENSSTTKVGNIIHQVFQCQQYCYLQAQKISMMYTEINIALKAFESF